MTRLVLPEPGSTPIRRQDIPALIARRSRTDPVRFEYSYSLRPLRSSFRLLAGRSLQEDSLMRSLLVCLAGVVVFGMVAVSQSACADDKETVQAADAPVGIETGQMFVTIENRAGTPLLDLTIAIQPPAGAPPFTYLVSRLEGGQKRDVPLSSFSSRDGTTFNLRMVRPRSVRVTATDLVQKKYNVQAPWK
jgi:hypothetical protein